MEDLKLLEELKENWPSWKIDWVFDYAFDKLRNILGINFIYLSHSDWKWDEGFDDCYMIKISYQRGKEGHKEEKQFTSDLFLFAATEGMSNFDDEIGAFKCTNLTDKVILRIARHFRNIWGEKPNAIKF